MPLHLTKIAHGCDSIDDLREWLERDPNEARLTTRYMPKRLAEMEGGSLFWIYQHTLIGRSPILGFEQRPDDGRWWIRLEPRLIPVEPRRKRAHQGWRYLAEEDAPGDLDSDIESGDTMPGRLISELAKLGLV